MFTLSHPKQEHIIIITVTIYVVKYPPPPILHPPSPKSNAHPVPSEARAHARQAQLLHKVGMSVVDVDNLQNTIAIAIAIVIATVIVIVIISIFDLIIASCSKISATCSLPGKINPTRPVRVP